MGTKGQKWEKFWMCPEIEDVGWGTLESKVG